MEFDQPTIDKLEEKLDPKLVAQREGGFGKKLSYIEGYVAIDQANRIFGYDGWSMEVQNVQYREVITGVDQNGTITHRLEWYEATVKVQVGDAVRTDVGVTEVQTTRTGEQKVDFHDMAYKGAVTDAMKRALRTFGAQFGNSLYDKDAPQPQQQQRPQGQQQGRQPPQQRQQQQQPRNGDEWVPCEACNGQNKRKARYDVCLNCNKAGVKAPAPAQQQPPQGRGYPNQSAGAERQPPAAQQQGEDELDEMFGESTNSKMVDAAKQLKSRLLGAPTDAPPLNNAQFKVQIKGLDLTAGEVKRYLGGQAVMPWVKAGDGRTLATALMTIAEAIIQEAESV